MESQIPFFGGREAMFIEGGCDCEPCFKGLGAHPGWT